MLFRPGRIWSGFILSVLVVFMVLGSGASSASAQAGYSKIYAVYNIYLSGLHVGDFTFVSRYRGNRYRFQGITEINPPLLSLFVSWYGRAQANGTMLSGSKARPSRYDFSFRSKKKSGGLRIRFTGNSVTEITSKTSSEKVSLRPGQLANVVDPLSALMLLKRKTRRHASVCNNTLPMFDGKQRFDLKLYYKHMRRISVSDTNGYKGPAIVCGVRYIPVSGHKSNDKTVKFYERNRNIEIWLIPLPRTRHYVPYKIFLPTPLGQAMVKPEQFYLRKYSGRRIALIRR